MGLPHRAKIARTLLFSMLIAAVAPSAAGCVRVVAGRALMAGPKPGSRCGGHRAVPTAVGPKFPGAHCGGPPCRPATRG